MVTILALRPQPAADAHSRAAGRILVGVAIVLSAFNLRTAVTSFAPLAETIGGQLSFSHNTIGVFGMLPVLMFSLAGVLTPAVGRRIGLERTALLAMLLALAGAAVRSVMSDVGLMLAFSAVALAGMGIGNVVIPPLVKRYFSDRLALLSAAYITAVQLGTVVPAFVAVPVAEAFGWRVSIGWWALVALAAAAPWIAIIRSRRGHDVQDVTGVGAGPGIAVWRTRLGWAAALMFGMTSLITYSMFAWLPTLFVDAGASRGFGGAMVGLFSLVGFAATIPVTTLAARLPNPYPIVVFCVLCYTIGFSGLLFAPMSAPVLWVALTGLGPSTFPLALALVNLRTRTPSGSSALSGFMQGVGYAIAGIGPLLFGVLHDLTGGWATSFTLVSAAVVIAAVAGWLACRPGFLEDGIAR